MDCPFCAEPMEREDGYMPDRAGKIGNQMATYTCETCGRSYEWELGVPGIRPLFAPEYFDPPYFPCDDNEE